MFWNKPKKEDVITTVTDSSGKYVSNNNVVVVHKMDELDMEFLRRHHPEYHDRLIPEWGNENFYIITDVKQGWKVINQQVLDSGYTKVGG